MVFSLIPSSLANSGCPQFSVSTVQAKKRSHKTPQLLDQQVAILVGLAVSPNWVQEQSAAGNLIYGIVRPGDTVPSGVKDDSYLASSGAGAERYLFFNTVGNQVVIRYATHGDKLHTKTVTVKRLADRFYRTKGQRHRVDQYVSSLRIE